MKEQKKGKKMSPRWPGFWDISFQSQEFEQDGSRHFGGFQPHFHINMTSQTQSCKTKKKLKVRYLRSLLFDVFEILQTVRTWQRDFSWFQISLLWQPKSTQLSFIEKTKGLLFKQKCFSKIIWNNTVELLLHLVSFYEEKLMKHFSYCEKTIVFCFWTKAYYSYCKCQSKKIWNQAIFLC